MANKVNAIPVTVYMDAANMVCPDGSTRYIDCNYKFVANENINLTAGGNNCVNYQPGDVWPEGVAAEGVSVQATVKISTDKGFLWISATSFSDLNDACNDCCDS